jgi:hypothetical protein
MLDMTEALRPSELFALRWRSFDNSNTLSITETVYRRQIRPFGKTPKSLGKGHQAHPRHAKADTTANEYMQELPESVQQMVGSVSLMLVKGGEDEKDSGRLLPEEQLVSS